METARTPLDARRDDPETAELLQQGGVVANLMRLAEAIREASAGVALAVEHVAMGLDAERRGPLSVLHRSDDGQIMDHIEKVLSGALLNDQSREYLLEGLAGMAAELRARVPLWTTRDRGIDAAATRRRVHQYGRERGVQIAKALGVEPRADVEVAPSPTASPQKAAPSQPTARRGIETLKIPAVRTREVLGPDERTVGRAIATLLHKGRLRTHAAGKQRGTKAKPRQVRR